MRRSVAANIDFVLNPGTRSRQRRDEVLQHAGLYRQRSQPARLLSGGEQQRLALARALATEPEVLLLDEPCASLDSATTLQIENLLQETSARGVKIVLVTHDIGQARRLADDVIFMHGGRLLEYQTASTFFDSPSSSQARAYLDGKIVI
jgi:tungstate transport system ATP-binding protein